MPLRNKFAFLISLISYFFLIPGVTLTALSVHQKEAVTSKIANIHMNLLHTNNSILDTVHQLYKNDYQFVAVWVFIFSIVVPLVKGILFTYVFVSKDKNIRNKIYRFINSIGKWSMCDVFIAATFLAYLASGTRVHSETHQVSVFIFTYDVNLSVQTVASLGIGFYCFLTYCLLSLVALQLYDEY